MDASHLSLSFELFPPKTLTGFENLKSVWRTLQDKTPDYFSVTFGAAGGNQDKTMRVVRALRQDFIEVAPHLTCIGLSKTAISDLLNNYRLLGIKRIVALRGDLPLEEDIAGGDFNHANELVAYIRKLTGDYFHIEVAAYPEFHPETRTVQEALKNFQQKIAAGANGAITQYFYNRDAYFNFVDACRNVGIKAPIVPGIMPISDFDKLVRFSKTCATEIPRWLYKRLESYKNDKASLKAYGVEVVTKLCEDLIAYGVPGLHFYTLNQCEPTQTIIENLQSITSFREQAVVA
ncbi:methylenetetrahydrofolate reductase [NAD(P)H] [Coxiella burnetii]|uniref:methylenetetrahydrofolate reductase [NAD(P)H] n=1 Tax=Coxiella burnetii TaxID=777 RepID=UPI000183CF09|nr:methylenetetrahydrofolate reductase [NAD(P)H] [Coxiella burnetii]ACJ19289.1 methylenetetrahydrofolate reductase [Coxiella burnetii CbuG_Q212]ATN67610.1 5,10-methylenetetrahydrofolate reductase [Coxiella burnetii]OYK85353.1 methylenetetrahydrofolate reductase [NAD(P)H] [Coxiella burnetii]